MQTLNGRDHELRLSEHLVPGTIGSAGSYPAMNHADALPPTRYTSTMGNEDPGPPHVAIVSINSINLHALFADGAGAEGP